RRRHRRLGLPVAGPQVLREGERDQRGDVRVLEGRGRGQLSWAGANVMSATSTVPSASAARGSRTWLAARTDLRTSSSTGIRRAIVAAFAASVTVATGRPTETPPSDLALLIAVRVATARSKQPGSAGAAMPARSSGP